MRYQFKVHIVACNNRTISLNYSKFTTQSYIINKSAHFLLFSHCDPMFYPLIWYTPTFYHTQNEHWNFSHVMSIQYNNITGYKFKELIFSNDSSSYYYLMIFNHRLYLHQFISSLMWSLVYFLFRCACYCIIHIH